MDEQNEVVVPEVVEETEQVVTPEDEAKAREAAELAQEKRRQEVEEQKRFFQLLRQGAMFLKYVNKDLARQRTEKLNRASRRRIEKAIQKGVFTQDVIDAYSGKLNDIIAFFDLELAKYEKKEIVTNE